MHSKCLTCIWTPICSNEELEICEETGVCEDYIPDDWED